jgi:hypothetical protein
VIKLDALMLPDGSLYFGTWHCGHRFGKGQQRFADNSIYDGHWVDDI